jgi:hypothetical protein
LFEFDYARLHHPNATLPDALQPIGIRVVGG